MSILAVILYLLPVALFLAARSRNDTALWAIALDIPLAVALDLLSVLALTRFVTLETAIFTSRALWLVGAASWLGFPRNRAKLALPRNICLRDGATLVLGASVALYISLRLSRPCAIWDRTWHIPLVTSLLGQKLPFSNVYEPRGGLYYHFSGDVLAAMFQALSFSTIHSSLALSLAHDVMFTLTGVVLVLLLRAFGIQSRGAILAVIIGMLMTGPATLLHEGDARPANGYSIVNFLSLSFRPHVSLAALSMLGFVGAVFVRLRERAGQIPFSRTFPALLLTTALLAITDEASIGVLGVALGGAWLAAPNVVHPQRRKGVGVFLALAGALFLSSRLFGGSFGVGAPAHDLKLVAWQSPGFFTPPLPLSSEQGKRVLFEDLFPILGVLLAGAVVVLRARARALLAAYTFFAVLVGVSVVALTRFEADGSPAESHRFITAALFLAPLVAAFLVRARTANVGKPYASLEALAIYSALAIPVVATVEWLASGLAEKIAAAISGVEPSFDHFYRANCRKLCATAPGRQSLPTYVAGSIAQLYTGCSPTFVPGPKLETRHKIKVGASRSGLDALREIHEEMLPRGLTLDVFCNADSNDDDPVCKYATQRGLCGPSGTRVRHCTLAAAQRREVLGSS